MLLDEVVESLHSTQTGDHFCTSLSIPADDLSISVSGVGDISGMISPKNAKALIKESRLASFGWKDQTVVDTRVRNVWEIAKTKVTISKRSFDKVFTPVLEQIKRSLNLAAEGELTAELHNLLVYEPGQFFSSHQDSEKNDGMLATMVVLLPSDFNGGSLVIAQHASKKTFRSVKAAADKWHVTAFYADCHHEVKKVTSGYRVALTFNLSFTVKGNLQPAQLNPKLTQQIRQYFMQIMQKPKEDQFSRREHPRWLVYLLDHQYSQKGLRWSHLKGSDRTNVSQLRGAADELGLTMHLALAELHITWEAEAEYSRGYGRRRYPSRYHDDDEWDEHDISNDAAAVELGDVIDEEYSLAHWIDGTGKRVRLPEHRTPQEMFCWTKAIDEFKPFESQYEGYMGNYGNTMDHWYHRAAVVLWPADAEYPSLFAIDPAMTLSKIKTTVKRDLALGCKILKQILPQWDLLQSTMEPQDKAKLLALAASLGNPDLAHRVLSLLGLEVVCKKNCNALSQLIALYGEAWMVTLLRDWSKNGRYRSEKISDLTEVTRSFLDRTEVVDWLQQHQFALITSDDQQLEKSGGRVRIEDVQAAKMKGARELLEAAAMAGDKRKVLEFVDHILQHRRVYANLTLAQLAYDLGRDSAMGQAWQKLRHEATARLSMELAQPRTPGDVSIMDKIPCKCGDCAHLAQFLRSPSKRELVWPIAKDRRQHIHVKIDNMGIGVSHTTQRSGSPHKLVLKKLDKHFAREVDYRKNAASFLKLLNQV